MPPHDTQLSGPAPQKELAGPRSGSLPSPLAIKGHCASNHRDAIFDLRAALEQARRGASVIVELTGSQGSGKSRLLKTFAAEQDQTLVLSGACRPNDWRPFSLLRRIFDGYLAGRNALPASRQQAIAASLAAAAGDMLPWLSMLVPEFADMTLQPSPPVLSGDAQHSFIGGVANFILNYIKDNKPAVILIDDLQWLEGSSSRVLMRIVAELRNANALLVLAHQDSEEGYRIIQRLLQVENVDMRAQIKLGKLSASEAMRITIDTIDGTRPSPAFPVDATVVEHLMALTNGTPLALRSLIDHALDAKCLVPVRGSWRLNSDLLANKVGSRSPTDLAAEKLRRIPEVTHGLLCTLAVADGELSTNLLAQAHNLSTAQLLQTIAPAVRQDILVLSQDQLDFTRDASRRAVSQTIDKDRLCREHLRLAQVLQRQPHQSAEIVFNLARHYANAADQAPPALAQGAALRAAKYAASAHDNHRTLFFLELAEQVGARMGTPLPHQLLADLAESCWQNGYVNRSESYYHQAIKNAEQPLQRSNALGHLAWVQHYSGQSREAQRNIESALRALDWSDIHASTKSVATAVLNWGTKHTLRGSRLLAGRTQAASEALCAQHLRAYRIFTETGRITDGLLALIQANQLAYRMQSCEVASRAISLSAGPLTLLGQHELATRALSRAEGMATTLNTPVALAWCHVMRHVAAAWRGDVDSARKHARLFAVDHGHFADLGDFCLLCLGMVVMETTIGEPELALEWIERIISRAVLHGQAPAIVSLVGEAAQATLATLGREHLYERTQQHLALFQTQPAPNTSQPHLLSYNFRLQRLAELGITGADFESLAKKFESRAANSQLASPLASAGYVHILHARIHRGIRGTLPERIAVAGQIKTLLKALTRAIRGELARSHQLLGRAAVHWFCGRLKRAESLLAEADRLAHLAPCPWVLFTVARIRAHMYEERGRPSAALQHAGTAALIAQNHHHANRQQWIAEEFPGLAKQAAPVSAGPVPAARGNAPRMRRHLDTLLRISRTGSADLSPNRQAEIILEEVAQSLDAEIGHLILPNAGPLRTVAHYAPERHQDDACNPPPWVVDAAYGAGQLIRLEPGQRSPGHAGQVATATLAAPLVLRGEAIGVICLQRESSSAHFDAHEGELLLDLSSQVPIALELAKSLRARENLEDNLKQSQKMEAIGQLAGGIAHDFNNLLSTIQLSGSALQNCLLKDGQGREEIADILDVAARGSALTNQLLTFAKRKTTPPQRIDINSNVTALVPMLTRLVGGQFHIHTDLHDMLPDVIADPIQVDQVLLNLITNARDATNSEGRAEISTERVEITQQSAATGFPLPPGTYVTLAVTDNGSGIPQEVQQKVFEPFYSTKPSNRGTGLGLASVYGIVQQHSGHIELKSSTGSGTTFTVYWPAATQTSPPMQLEPELESLSGQDASIRHLVVVAPPGDARAELAKALHTETHHDVFSVSTQAELREILDDLGGDVSGVIYTTPPHAKDLATLGELCVAPNATAATIFNIDDHEIDELNHLGVSVHCYPTVTSVDAMVQAVLQSLGTTASPPTLRE